MEQMKLDWNKYLETARQAAAEGMVLLENNGALPLKIDETLAVFGRIQEHYYKSGTGSGGLVNVTKVWNITEGLEECGITLEPTLRAVYAAWEAENPIDKGVGWGGEPWSQREMPLSDEVCAAAAKAAPAALCIIGRTAGEEQDQSESGGSYLLSDTELEMLRTVRRHFRKMTVVLNVGGIIDMKWVADVSPDAVLYAWQGGMVGGLATADVLTGRASPCGKLTDTIARSISDYPSAPYFGDKLRNFYSEDIYVGYRWFETFAPEKVLYPFGCGLSYTSFDIKPRAVVHSGGTAAEITVDVTNTGGAHGKEVVCVYVSAPQGRLGKPARVLCAFAKTRVLAPRETQTLTLRADLALVSSYDDGGVTGERFCYILEEGRYAFYVGTDVRSAALAGDVELPQTVVSRCKTACAPVLPFERIVNKNGFPVKEATPLCTKDMDERRAEELPAEIPQTGDCGIKLCDVVSGAHTMSEFIAQLTDEELSCIVRGEGMGSPLVTAGTASAFGGVTESLREKGVPCGCCDDGPSGMRLDCGTKAFSLPNGTMLACAFNTELVERLYALAGVEVAANKVECLLGPGMNIHRHPLNGRNFEYFSEDPLVTGKTAAAQVRGLHSAGVSGTIKHFCANNQETGRHVIDSVASERALREIYLRGFEIAVKEGGADSVMTTYGSLNGLWTAGNYDLCTTILRGEWGFNGMVMTDWWADINERGTPQGKTNFAQMVRAQNDVYMVCADSARNNDNTLSSLAEGLLTRGELQRCAANICAFAAHSNAMRRLCGALPEIVITNRPADENAEQSGDVVFHKLDGAAVIPLEGVSTERGSSYVFALDVQKLGKYHLTLTAKSSLSHTAQLPVTFFKTGFPECVFTFSGTDGKWAQIERSAIFYSRFITCRLYFAQGGLELKELSFNFLSETIDGQMS